MEWNGNKLKERIKTNKTSKVQLAKELDVSRQSIDNWIKGQIPKGKYLINLCKILKTSPNYFFNETTKDEIFVPVHRTRKKAKITSDMQEAAYNLAKIYAIFFKSCQNSNIVPVIRACNREIMSVKQIATTLRNYAKVKSNLPINYNQVFKLIETLGINLIFYNFPSKIKSYAFYTKIYGHRVVFINNSTNILDLIFPLLHEAVHAIRDEYKICDEYDEIEEKFCDNVANYTQFPDDYINLVYNTTVTLTPAKMINNLKHYSSEYGHSLYGIIIRLKEKFPKFKELKLNVGGADTNLKKNFPTIGNLFNTPNSIGDYIQDFFNFSPNFARKLLYQLPNISDRKLSELLCVESVLDTNLLRKEFVRFGNKLQRF
jgi:transcriptional regulator with XRE-family HTH domain